MMKVQMILHFTRPECLSAQQQSGMHQIVKEAVCRHYCCAMSDVETSLHGAAKDPRHDLVLAFQCDRKRLNEGALRSAVKKDVAAQLMKLLGADTGFCGSVTTKDGLEDLPAQAAAPAAPTPAPADKAAQELDYVKRAQNYQAVDPVYDFDMVKLPPPTLERIDLAISRILLEREVFDDWGLYAIMPNPVCAISFFGPPGTGKTLAANAVASKVHKKIIRTSYADIESKYHGEGPKNVRAIFLAAEQQDAVLFIDEADSLLSKRLTSVSQGSEQAINSMRSELLICLENFHGIVVFATNLVVNYDKAFLSRLINIRVDFPDANLRRGIWDAHLHPAPTRPLHIPLADDVDTEALGNAYEACGREIRNAVVSACVAVRMAGRNLVRQADLCKAIEDEIKRRDEAVTAEDHTAIKPALSREAQAALAGPIKSITENRDVKVRHLNEGSI